MALRRDRCSLSSFDGTPTRLGRNVVIRILKQSQSEVREQVPGAQSPNQSSGNSRYHARVSILLPRWRRNSCGKFLKQEQSRLAAGVGPRATVPEPDTRRGSRTSWATFGSCPLVCIHVELITAALGIGLQRALTVVDWSRLNSHHVIPFFLLIYARSLSYVICFFYLLLPKSVIVYISVCSFKNYIAGS